MEGKSVLLAKLPTVRLEGVSHKKTFHVVLPRSLEHVLIYDDKCRVDLYSLTKLFDIEDREATGIYSEILDGHVESTLFSEDGNHFAILVQSQPKKVALYSINGSEVYKENELFIGSIERKSSSNFYRSTKIECGLNIENPGTILQVQRDRVCLYDNFSLSSYRATETSKWHQDIYVDLFSTTNIIDFNAHCLYCLHESNIICDIDIYNLKNAKLDGVFDLSMILPQGVQFKTICVNKNGTQVAMLGLTNLIYVVDVFADTSVFQSPDQNDYRGGSFTQEAFNKTLPPSASGSTVSNSWFTYLDRLANKKKNYMRRQAVEISNAFVCIRDIPHDYDVKSIHFCQNILTVCAVNSDGTNVYRMYNTSNGTMESEDMLSADTQVVRFDSATLSLDLFIQQSNLCLPLEVISRHTLFQKVEGENESQMEEMNQVFGHAVLPLILLNEGISRLQLDVVQLALNLHAQAFKPKLSDANISVEELLVIVKELFGAVLTSVKVEDDEMGVEGIQWRGEVRRLALTHANTLLAGITPPLLQTELQTEILNYVVALRDGEDLHTVEAPVIPQWTSWLSLSDEDVIINAITSVPLVQCFLILHRGWTNQDLSGQRFYECALNVCEQLLLKEELNQAKILLNQLSMDERKELKTLCFKCQNPKLRDYIVSNIPLDEEEINAWKFLKTIEGVLTNMTNTFSTSMRSPLTISTVLIFSAKERSQITTDLYFTTSESSLEDTLNKHSCWEYLLENNCIEGIFAWIGSETSSSKFPWPLGIFSAWEVDQQMVDQVLVSDCTDLTKYTILNKLASHGLLTTQEIHSPKKLLTRMAYAELFPDLDVTLNKSSSNFNSSQFSNLILQHAINNNLVELAVKFNLNGYSSDDSSPDWVKLYKVHTQPAFDVWSPSDAIRRVESTTEYLASHESLSTLQYLKQHPLVAIVTDILKGEDVCQKYSHVSPLLAVGAPSSKSTPSSSTGDVTLYSLLANAVPFHTDNIFQHQISGQKDSPLPDFTSESLSLRYGSKYSLGYRDLLKQGRPASAISSIMKNGRFSIKCQCLAKSAHGLALSYCCEPQVSFACVAFTEMLGQDSCNLRTHLATAKALKSYIAPDKLEEHMVCLAEGREASSVLAELEGVLGRQWLEDSVGGRPHVSLQQFHLAVRLAVCHALPAPDSLLRHSLETGNWLMFVLAAQIFQYPVSKVLQIISESGNREISKHLYYALRLDPKNNKESMDLASLEPHSDLFGILAQLGNDAEALFAAGRRLNSPILALLAASLQFEQVDRGMCEWLVASLTPADADLCPTGPWAPDSITQLLEIVIQQGYLRTLARAFFTFQPLHPFCALASFFVDCVHEYKFNESNLNLKLFMAAYFNLPNETKICTSLTMNKNWLSLTAYRMACSTLAYCFPSEYLRRSFLKTLCEASFSDIHKDGQHLPLLLRLSQCLAETSLQLDWKRICLQKDLSQLSELLLKLSDELLFDTAFKFANIANLPVDLVLVSQWSLLADSSERKEHGFWNRCESAFQQGNIDPEAAVCFYRKQALVSEELQENIYILLKYALNWMLKTNAKYDEINALQTELYMTCLEEKFNLEIITEGVVKRALHCLSSELSPVPSPSPPQLTVSQSLRLDDIIHQLLVMADIRTAFQLQVLFNHTNQDCELLLACMQLAEGYTTVAQLPSRIQDCLTMENVRRHPISFSSPIRKMRSSNNLLQVVKQDVLNALYTLQAHQTCSTFLFGNIISGYKISVALQCDYKDVIMDSEPLSRLLPSHDFEIATCLMNLACLTRYDCTQYVCSQLVSILSYDSGENGKYMLWGCDIEKEFSCILDLNISALLLGNLLMVSDLSMSPSFQPPTYRREVEVLILAHSCFTLVCHMEGISAVLNSARSLINRLLDCRQWLLMVRLLTGIGRYTELNFVFQILKENDQFECLLGKGLDKEPRMMAATLEFARHDPELFSLVAHHFSMLGELGALYEAEAKAALTQLEADRGHLAPTAHNTNCLNKSMTQFTDAAEHYVQAKKMKCAVWNIQQAELVAVQLNMMANTTLAAAPCLVNLPESQVLRLIYSVLSFEEAHIVASAYNAGVDWSAALFHHCVAGGDFGYLTSWLRHHTFTSTTVQDVVNRFQNEAELTVAMEDNMKQFVSFVNQLDVKYRVASQLGFKDMLENMLSSPDMAYLKDTVWQSGFKRHTI